MNKNLWTILQAGEKRQFVFHLPGTGLTMPVTVIGGLEDGPSVLITTGIHGSEYPGTLAVIELAANLRPEQITGRLIMVHPVNTSAFQARAVAILPEDGLNINRLFPGDPQGSESSKIAWWLTELTDQADFYLDLHSGDLYEELTPYAYYPGNAEEKVVARSKDVARVLDVPYIVRSAATTGAYNSAALRGTPSLLIERGGAGYCRRREVDLYKEDIGRVLKRLKVLPGDPEPPARPSVEIGRVVYLESKHDALWQSQVNPGQKVSTGQPLGRIFDFFGQTIEEYPAEMDGIVLYQLYPLSTNKGDVLVAYGSWAT